MTDSTTPMAPWTDEDNAVASEQGWAIFSTGRCSESEASIVNGKPYGHRPFELQRDDEMEVFADDAAAHAFVREAIRKGDGLAMRAAEHLKQVSPLEYEALMAG